MTFVLKSAAAGVPAEVMQLVTHPGDVGPANHPTVGRPVLGRPTNEYERVPKIRRSAPMAEFWNPTG